MPYPPALSEGALYKANLLSIKQWIESNKGRIKARPNETALYSGRIYDLDVMHQMDKEDRELFKGTPVYLTIEKHRKAHADRKIPFGYQTLEQVLKAMRDHPVLIDKDRQEKHFSSAFEFFGTLKSQSRLLPDVNAVDRYCWDRLSEIFAANAQGDIRILDGLADDFGKLDKQKVLLRKELDALLKNTRLSTAAKAVLLKKITKYGELFDHRYTQLIKQLDADTAHLKHPLKR